MKQVIDIDDNLLDFLKVHTAYQCRVIPNQNKFTFISKKSGFPEVWTLDENMRSVRYGHYHDRVLDVYHSPSGTRSVISIDKDGDEKQQFYLQEGSTSNIKKLVYSPEHFHKFGGWSPDSKHISFSSNKRHPGYFDVFIQEVETKEIKKVFQYDGICEPVSWLPDGEGIVISVNETNIENKLFIFDLKSEEITQIGKEDVLATYSTIQLTKDKRDGYILTNMEEEMIYLGRFSLHEPTNIKKIFSIDNCDLEEIQLSTDEKCVAFTINKDGYSQLAVYDIDSEQSIYVDNVPRGVINSLAWLNSDQLIFSLKTPTIPGDIWCYTLSTGNIERMTSISPQKGLENLLIEPKLYTFESFDGTKIPYFLYDNQIGKNKPAVVYVHGGPESQSRPTYNPVIQYLAYQGFSVATPNVRGSKGYGQTYLKMDDGRKRMDAVKDLVWLVKDLSISHGINKYKVGVMGESYGGFMTLAALAHFPNMWCAGVDMVGISHFKTFLKNAGSWRRRLRESEYGYLDYDSDFFEEIAPLNHAKEIKAPLLVFHGRNDTRVPVSESEQLVDDMLANGQKVKLTIFPNEGHQTEKVENSINMHRDTITFFRNYLLD